MPNPEALSEASKSALDIAKEEHRQATEAYEALGDKVNDRIDMENLSYSDREIVIRFLKALNTYDGELNKRPNPETVAESNNIG